MEDTEKEMDFWEFLRSWAGEGRMWEDVEPGNNSPSDMSWIMDGLTLGWLIRQEEGEWGWIIFCKSTRFCITGSFWERSISATSYRAELIGLCALHFLARVVAEF